MSRLCTQPEDVAQGKDHLRRCPFNNAILFLHWLCLYIWKSIQCHGDHIPNASNNEGLGISTLPAVARGISGRSLSCFFTLWLSPQLQEAQRFASIDAMLQDGIFLFLDPNSQKMPKAKQSTCSHLPYLATSQDTTCTCVCKQIALCKTHPILSHYVVCHAWPGMG